MLNSPINKFCQLLVKYVTKKRMEEYFYTRLYLASQDIEVEKFDWSSLSRSLELDGFTSVQVRRLETSDSENLTPNLLMAVFCVICAGLASGLTQGLLSLDIMDMRIKAQSGTPKERECAAKVLPIIQNHHLLLVTLMLWNASAAEALPVFLDKIVPEFVAVIISVTLVLLFGEILPSSLLTGPKQLEIAAALSPLVYLAYGIFFPVAYPIAKLLDCFIGHDEGMTIYTRAEIKTMLNLMYEEASKIFQKVELPNPLPNYSFFQFGKTKEKLQPKHMMKDEFEIIDGALRFHDIQAQDVMTPLENVFSLSLDKKLSYETLEYISKAGFSKIPIFDGKKEDIVGLVYTRDLMFVDPDEHLSVKEVLKINDHKLLSFWFDENLSDILTVLRREKEQIAFILDVLQEDELKDPIYCIRGIVTVEDIIEEIFGRKLWNLSLSDWEVQMISDYIMKNVPQLALFYSSPSLSNHSKVYELVRRSEVCFLKKQTPRNHSKTASASVSSQSSVAHYLKPLINALNIFGNDHGMNKFSEYAEEDVLIHGRRFLDHCIIILQGQVKLIHDDAAHSEEIFGPWTVIGADVLVSGTNTYSPHFTVIVHSRQVKFIRIKPFSNMNQNMFQGKDRSSTESCLFSHLPAKYLPTLSERGKNEGCTASPRLPIASVVDKETSSLDKNFPSKSNISPLLKPQKWSSRLLGTSTFHTVDYFQEKEQRLEEPTGQEIRRSKNELPPKLEHRDDLEMGQAVSGDELRENVSLLTRLMKLPSSFLSNKYKVIKMNERDGDGVVVDCMERDDVIL